MVLGCFVWLRQESNKSKKDWASLESHAICFNSQAKIDSGDAKNMADKSTKITIFFIIWEAL